MRSKQQILLRGTCKTERIGSAETSESAEDTLPSVEVAEAETSAYTLLRARKPRQQAAMMELSCGVWQLRRACWVGVRRVASSPRRLGSEWAAARAAATFNLSYGQLGGTLSGAGGLPELSRDERGRREEGTRTRGYPEPQTVTAAKTIAGTARVPGGGKGRRLRSARDSIERGARFATSAGAGACKTAGAHENAAISPCHFHIHFHARFAAAPAVCAPPSAPGVAKGREHEPGSA